MLLWAGGQVPKCNAKKSRHETDLGQEVSWGRGRVNGRVGVGDMREKQRGRETEPEPRRPI